MAAGRETISQSSLVSSGAEPGSGAEQRGTSCGELPSAPPKWGMEPGKSSQHQRAGWETSASELKER